MQDATGDVPPHAQLRAVAERQIGDVIVAARGEGASFSLTCSRVTPGRSPKNEMC